MIDTALDAFEKGIMSGSVSVSVSVSVKERNDIVTKLNLNQNRKKYLLQSLTSLKISSLGEDRVLMPDVVFTFCTY
jgi:hypothetical protein